MKRACGHLRTIWYSRGKSAPASKASLNAWMECCDRVQLTVSATWAQEVGPVAMPLTLAKHCTTQMEIKLRRTRHGLDVEELTPTPTPGPQGGETRGAEMRPPSRGKLKKIGGMGKGGMSGRRYLEGP